MTLPAGNWNSNISDVVVDKIRKLLALAQNNDNECQAEAALLKAQELAIRSEIDLATIEVFQDKKAEEEIVKGDNISLNGAREMVCQKFIYWILQSHFKVRIIRSGGRAWGRYITFLGTKTDIQIATYVNSFLQNEFMRLWHNYRKENPSVKTTHRNCYWMGVYHGLDKKLESQKTKVQEDIFDSMSLMKTGEEVSKVRSCYALAVRSQEDKLAKAMAALYPHLKKSTTYRLGGHQDKEISDDGFGDGQRINIHNPIGNGTSVNGYISA